MIKLLNKFILFFLLPTILFSCRIEEDIDIANKVDITQINITRFPELNGSKQWDTFMAEAKPDIFLRVSTWEGVIYESGLIQNATYYNQNIFTLLDPIRIDNLYDELTFELFDYDFLEDVYMAGIEVDFSRYAIGQKSPMLFRSDNFEMVLDLKWLKSL